MNVILHPDDRKLFFMAAEAHLAGKTPIFEVEHRVLHKGGEIHWFYTKGTVVRDHVDWVRRFTGTSSDISVRKRAELALQQQEAQQKEAQEALNRSQALLASINQNISEAIYRSTPGGQLVYVNQAFMELFGCASLEEMLNTPSVQLYNDPNQRATLKKLAEKQGYLRAQEVEFLRKDGTTFWGLMSSQKVLDDDGALLFYDGAILNITERKRQREELVIAKEEAEEMNRLKTSFLANMSHEIRTPLTSIIGFAEILSEEAEEDTRELAGLIFRSGQRLMETLNFCA